ncbi:glutamate--tRNA ligase [Patescibacteria group bacterium]|jgi:glutamyl-tRNA synthetase|nr:glutamate--tRNA ligase [Patescibacteria group bacterium]
MDVVTRIPPSPTGHLHVGTARTALYNFLFARKHGGQFLFRSEDTDRARSDPAFEEEIIEGLQWLGLSWDSFSRQSERGHVYREKLEELLRSERAYLSREPSKQDPSQEVEVVRLHNPGEVITFQDAVRGEISFDTAELGDLVIARSLDDALYHLTVVVDDALSGVTHVIRGEDHISNTPRQILIQEALGLPQPTYAHLPLLLGADRSKLSKRHGAVQLSWYRAQGYLPEALVNYLALLGWNPGTDQELFSMDELIDAFDLAQVQKGGAVFSLEKLGWFNRQHLARLPEEERLTQLTNALGEHPDLAAILTRSPAARRDALERVDTLGELEDLAREGEFDLYQKRPTLDPAQLPFKKDPDPAATNARLAEVCEVLDTIGSGSWQRDAIEAALSALGEREGKGLVYWPVRYALSGRDRSPDPATIAEALGRDETLARLRAAHELLP